MTFGPTKRYPAGPITPHGAFHILRDRIPQLALRAYDDSIVFNMLGGLAICDRTMPERVELKDLTGLIPPWQIIDQKGASQDGVTFVDALYDPIEIQLDVDAVGRDPAYTRQVVRDLVASIDTKQECELSWTTHAMGRWWSKVRWFKTPADKLNPINSNRQALSLRLRADSGFWESYPNVDQFRFAYTADSDDFERVTAPGDNITGWTMAYSGAGSGTVYTDGAQVVSSLTNRTCVLRRTSYTATTDNQISEIELGTNVQWSYPPDTYIDLWIRMNNTGTAGTDGIRCRIGQTEVKLSAIDGGVETVIRTVPWTWWPQPGERFRLASGANNDDRTYTLLRYDAPVFTAKESGATSHMDSSHRKTGFGLAVLAGSVRPIGIRNWTTGDNNTIAQDGFVQRTNVGDQSMWDRYLCIGPGMFFFGNGPDSEDMVKFGPLLNNQVMQVRTDPRKRGVVDMTAVPPTPQEQAFFAQALADFMTFMTLSRGTAAATAIESTFGIQPPQGNPYSLLDGRFSVPIPPRSPGNPVTAYHVKVAIEDGSGDSQIIAAGTPKRRLPW